MQNDLTTGSVFRNVLSFSLPYLLSYFLQTLYGMADLFIIGQFEGVASTTAVSIGSQVMHMLTVMLVGLAMGTTVSIARAVGGRNHKQISENVGNTVTLFFGLSIVLTVVLLLLVLGLLSKPLQLVTKLPVIHGANAVGGGALGLLWGALVVFVVVWALRKFDILLTPETVEQSRLLRFFAEHSPLDWISGL